MQESHAVLLIHLHSVWVKVCLCRDCLSKDFCIRRASGSRNWAVPNKYLFSRSSWKWCSASEIHPLKKVRSGVQQCNEAWVCDGVFQKARVMPGQEAKEEPKHIEGLMQVPRPTPKDCWRQQQAFPWFQWPTDVYLNFCRPTRTKPKLLRFSYHSSGKSCC